MCTETIYTHQPLGYQETQRLRIVAQTDAFAQPGLFSPGGSPAFIPAGEGEKELMGLGFARQRKYHGPSKRSPIRSMGTPFVSGIQMPKMTSPEKQMIAQKT